MVEMILVSLVVISTAFALAKAHNTLALARATVGVRI